MHVKRNRKRTASSDENTQWTLRRPRSRSTLANAQDLLAVKIAEGDELRSRAILAVEEGERREAVFKPSDTPAMDLNDAEDRGGSDEMMK
ncbi:hypothetical protein NDU88_008753 [Pleurodeles waltl]|uniref:Uncharacterized protein n=1 Tax=Pleurodeles waltl TaxID=8319 RepID=A0AAV7P5Z2_PLEWA|nr:hypothetical protein NDU88_008753 [Pleurodeles waltl]